MNLFQSTKKFDGQSWRIKLVTSHLIVYGLSWGLWTTTYGKTINQFVFHEMGPGGTNLMVQYFGVVSWWYITRDFSWWVLWGFHTRMSTTWGCFTFSQSEFVPEGCPQIHGLIIGCSEIFSLAIWRGQTSFSEKPLWYSLWPMVSERPNMSLLGQPAVPKFDFPDCLIKDQLWYTLK